jgi:hypothetical protein
VTRLYWLDTQKIEFRFPVGITYSPSVQPGSEAHPASYLMRTIGFSWPFTPSSFCYEWLETFHLPIRCHGVHTDNFTFTSLPGGGIMKLSHQVVSAAYVTWNRWRQSFLNTYNLNPSTVILTWQSQLLVRANFFSVQCIHTSRTARFATEKWASLAAPGTSCYKPNGYWTYKLGIQRVRCSIPNNAHTELRKR